MAAGPTASPAPPRCRRAPQCCCQAARPGPLPPQQVPQGAQPPPSCCPGCRRPRAARCARRRCHRLPPPPPAAACLLAALSRLSLRFFPCIAAAPAVTVADPCALLLPTTLPLLSHALPPPQAPLFSGLPQPAQKKKVVVQFRVPISFDRSEAAAAEEEVGGRACVCWGSGIVCTSWRGPHRHAPSGRLHVCWCPQICST
jgi:hypothetical protein